MGIIDKRLEALEATFAESLSSGPEELERELFREALRRLTLVEMCVMEELCDAYRSRPKMSPAQVWHELTQAQRALETHWRTTVRRTAHEMLNADTSLADGRRENLRKEVSLAVANYPFWRAANDGSA